MESTIKERLTAYLKYKGINKSEFGRKVGVSNSYISAIRKSIQPDKTEKIAASFPDLNIAWLLTGDGEMLKDTVTNIAQGDHATNIAGNGNNIRTDSSTLDKALDEIAEQRKLVSKAQDQVSVAQSQVTAAMEQVSKSQQQIDRLLSILETTNNV